MTHKEYKFDVLPAIQTPIVIGGEIKSWIMRVTMSNGTIVHSITKLYECNEEEIIKESESEKAGKILENIHEKLNKDGDWYDRCERELETIIGNL